ncbi:unnamed protein product [Notodromas monacha]|uniref:F-box domain-containing protein n=1 Tax=Notodromas monacha TaxID=399045 RepID=A0A7R9GB40_9CRUS|nr:unnamed protein product [Notodromas monacha]CAG0914676.1 unnamed protein product [Notodromas monacha]
MSAFLVRLDFGLRDLSYMELGRNSAPGDFSKECEKDSRKRTVEFYIEQRGGEVLDEERSRLRVHVHKLEDGVKIGVACRKEFLLHVICSIGEDPSGAFVMTTMNPIFMDHFNLFLCLNDIYLNIHDPRTKHILKHGDIIDGGSFFGPCFKVMFLLRDKCDMREPQTSLLLLCPWLVLENIMKFLSPLEMMEKVVPVCRKLFDLMRRGKIWKHLEFRVYHDGNPGMPFGHLDDFCKVVSGYAKKLSVDLTCNEKSRLPMSDNCLCLLFKHYEWSTLKILDIFCVHNEEAWVEFLLHEGKTLTQLETLTLRGMDLGDLLMRVAHERGNITFPRCKEVTLRCSMKRVYAVNLRKMFPRLEKLHFYHADVSCLLVSMLKNIPLGMSSLERFPDSLGSGLLSSLHIYQLPIQLDAEGWRLAHRMGIFTNLQSLSMSADLFDRMSAAETTIFFPKHKAVVKNPGKVFEELSGCPKLEGFILSVTSDLPLEPLRQMSQQLKFIAFPGTTLRNAWSALGFLSHCRNSLEDLWIQVSNPKEIKQILRALKAFKKLKNAVLVLTKQFEFNNSVLPEQECFVKTMQECFSPGCTLKQVTLLAELEQGLGNFVGTYGTERGRLVAFLPTLITRFCSEWLNHVPKDTAMVCESGANTLEAKANLLQAMRAFLVKLNFGLRDLSYIELGECESMQAGVHHHPGGIRKRSTTEFYVERFDVTEYEEKLACTSCIPMHVHKLEDGVKLGAPCSRQHYLQKVFSIEEELSNSKFVLKTNEKFDSQFDDVLEVQINRGVFSLHQKGSMFRLNHGDVIEFFFQCIPYFRVMFLLANECSEQVPQTSALLSCPWPVLQNIFQFLTPCETMENLIPVCQQFFQLMRSGAIWTYLKFNVHPEQEYVPYGHLGDFCGVIARLKRLHVIDIWKSSYREIRPNILTFLDFLGSGELRRLHATALPLKLSIDDWLLAQRRRTFADLESLTLRGGEFQRMPLAGIMRDVFPKLKSIWFQNVRVSPTNAIDHILEMPSLEKLWFRNVRSELRPEPIPLYFFDRRPKGWLENIKLISADTWERYIPYSRMINLEFVAFFLRDKTTGVTDTDVYGARPRSLEKIFEELRNCSKLKGLILRIPDGFRCTVLNELSQKLEFAAISAADINKVKSVLECLHSDQTRLEEVWIRVFSRSEFAFEEIIAFLMRFKRLRKVVFVYTPRPSPDVRGFDVDDYSDGDSPDDDDDDSNFRRIQDQCLNDYKRVLRGFADSGCRWEQATFLYDDPIERESFTYSFKLRRQTEFTSFAVTKFFSDWFEYVSDGKEPSEFRAADLISALFPEQTE